LLGGRGNDILLGGIGNDKLVGGAGGDLLVGGLGADKIDALDGEVDFLIIDNEDGVEKDPEDIVF